MAAKWILEMLDVLVEFRRTRKEVFDAMAWMEADAEFMRFIAKKYRGRRPTGQLDLANCTLRACVVQHDRVRSSNFCNQACEHNDRL